MPTRYCFTKIFTQKMKETLQKQLGNNYSIQDQFPLKTKEIEVKADLGITKSGIIFLIEFEIHRADPSNNAIKIYHYLLNNHKPDQRYVFVQFFSPYYSSNKIRGNTRSRRFFARFVGEELINKLDNCYYIPKDISKDSRKDFDDFYRSFKAKESCKDYKITSPDLEDKLDKLVKQNIDKILNMIYEKPYLVKAS